jgi:prolyl-tRNA editing enzyme YbaK/EbsC (Cys-tRNA(Pro) deacylase)
MQTELSPSAQRVQDALNALGMQLEVIELPDSTRTALEAAQAVGCEVGQIVKSLVFRAKRSGQPVLVIASGKNRVSERKLEALIGEPLGKANADFVRQQTGFAIGGVPPLGHLERLETYIDEDLYAYEQIWAAAGTPHAVFCLDPGKLEAMTAGQIVDLKEGV